MGENKLNTYYLFNQMENLFQNLRKEIRRDYGLTKRSSSFIPFEKWRKKLKGYSNEFEEEYSRNVSFLKKKLGLTNLRRIKNPNKKLILFLGLPGAGKTTLAKEIENFLPHTILLRGHNIVDYLRLYGKDVEIYRERLRERKFKYPGPWYISYFYQEKLTRDCLNLGYNVVFDDDIRTSENRLGYYELARQYNAKIIFIQINSLFKTCLQREEGRINQKKINFLANFVFQSEDFNETEKEKYFKIIEVNGNSKIKDLEKDLISQIA